MLVLAALMAAEKNLPFGRRLRTPVGLGLLGAAAAIVVRERLSPPGRPGDPSARTVVSPLVAAPQRRLTGGRTFHSLPGRIVP